MSVQAQVFTSAPQVQSVTTVQEQPLGSWQVSLCDCCASGCCNFFYGLLCPPCANASARTNMDKSDCFFNCLCLSNAAVARNIIREGYHIEGSCCGDIICGIFCTHCVSCQLLSETEKRGSNHQVWGPARSPQLQPFKHGLCSCCDNCSNCLCGFLCTSCAFAKARSDFDGSSCLFNWCCLTTCLTRSVIRDGYNIEGSCWGDMCLPIWCMWCTAAQLLNEVAERGKITKVFVQSNVVMMPNPPAVVSMVPAYMAR